MPSKTEQLANDLTVLAMDSGLGVDEILKAIGVFRSRVTRPSTQFDLDEWRRQRALSGPVGSSKKSTEMRTEVEAQKKKPGRKK